MYSTYLAGDLVAWGIPASGPEALYSFNAASSLPGLAAGAIVTAYGQNLGGATVSVLDHNGAERPADLVYALPGQISYIVPDGTAAGRATARVQTAGGAALTGALQISAVSPGIFSANSDGKGVAAAQAVLVGADGIGSVIRKALHPNEAPPRQSGLVAIRGLAHGVGHLLGELSGAQYFGRGLEAGLARANADVVYWFLSLAPSLSLGKSLVPLELVDEVTRDLHPPLRQIAMATLPADLRRDALVDREPIDAWGAGAVTLLGDAAHPMLPHAGQGAAQALEDAQALAEALSGPGEPEAALRRYERRRSQRTAAVVRLARRNARAGMITHPLACWLRDTAVQWVPRRAILKQMIALGRPPPSAP